MTSGALVTPYDLVLENEDGYFLVAASGLREVDLYHDFRNWVLEQVLAS